VIKFLSAVNSFYAIDFETANPARASACSVGIVQVDDYKIVDSWHFLINPVGGHAPFQTKIHGITELHTQNQPTFGDLYPSISHIFRSPIIAHGLFDKQVLNALSKHWELGLAFDYLDTCELAKSAIAGLPNYKLKTVAAHFGLSQFAHHDALEDALACAKIFGAIHGHNMEQTTGVDYEISISWPTPSAKQCDEVPDTLRGLVMGILADDVVNYKETLTLLYWLEDNYAGSGQHTELIDALARSIADGDVDASESADLRARLSLLIHD